ncbi:MAG: hypothetical protein P1P64_05110 [Treponemataceae bacterium]
MNDDLFDFSPKHPPEMSQDTGLRYNRERRLKNAPESVRKLHAGEYTKKRGLIKSLFATRASSALAFVILLMVAFITFYKRSSPEKSFSDFNAKLSYTIEAIGSKENPNTQDYQLFASVEIDPKTENLSGENISVIFFALAEKNFVLSHKEVSTIYLGEKQVLTSPLPLTSSIYNLKKITAQIQIADKLITLEQKIKIK